MPELENASVDAAQQSYQPRLGWIHWLAITIVTATVGLYYAWDVRAAGTPFRWGQNLSGYYDYLGRAFARGHLYLPIAPDPRLLALPDPWDPKAGEDYKMHDMALFHGRYYLYHGPGPAVLLFAPWRLVTQHDLPENFALFLLCFGGFLFSCAALIRLLLMAGALPGPALLSLLLLALGIAPALPYLLNRIWVYEVAIGGGYFCVSAALFFLVRGVDCSRTCLWLAASGLMFGMAIACRPHLGLAGAFAVIGVTVILARPRGWAAAVASRKWLAFVLPLVAVGTAVAVYNYARFGDVFEFGTRYLLSGPNQNRVKLALANVLPGLYYFLFCPPEFSAVFPWARLAFRYPFDSAAYPFPPEYFIEPTAGALFLAPFVIAALFIPFAARMSRGSDPHRSAAVRVLLWTVLASSAAILLFLTATGFTTQRYLVDFLPIAVWLALANLAIHGKRSSRLVRAALTITSSVAITGALVVNLALGISGPYDEMLQNRPASYLRIARWFSPARHYRPLLNPRVSVSFTTELAFREEGIREPLVTMGHQTFRHFLFVEHKDGKLRLVSRSDKSSVQNMVEPRQGPVQVHVTFAPESGNVTASLNGEQVLVHHIGILVTAPADVTPGENRIDPNQSVQRFAGRMQDVAVIVRP